MASGGITGNAFTLGTLFGDRTRYGFEYYQREYAWSADDVRTLLDDLFEEFEQNGRVRSTRRSQAPQYFLGPFVYADEPGELRFLVDGQQRFTTLQLVFLHLLRMAQPGAEEIRHRLRTAVVAAYDGKRPQFRLDVPERQRLVTALLQDRPFEIRIGDDLSVQNMADRSAQIAEQLAQRLDSNRLDDFVEWLLNRVVLVGIEAANRDDGFRIFESMNDRGMRLTSVDLMKSFLLSRARRDQEELNKRWRDMVAMVTRRRGDGAAPSEFLKAYLTGRAARFCATSTDTARIEAAPHVWVRDNLELVGLHSDGEPYHALVSELIELGRTYGDLTAAAARPAHENGRAAIYYNHVNGVTAQMALILASVQRGDTDSLIREKARIAANFVDLLVTLRIVHDESTRPEDLNEEVLAVVPSVRECRTAEDLGTVLGGLLPAVDFEPITSLGLRGDNRRGVRYLLARLTAYVEDALGRGNPVDEYLTGRWHIEHVFPNHAEHHPELEPRRFRALRSRVGGLGLLPAPDNMSVQDLPYHEKIGWYRSRSTVLAVLAPDHDQRNPVLNTFRRNHGVERTMRTFGRTPKLANVVETRGLMYRALAQRIWDPAHLGLLIPKHSDDEEATPAPRSAVRPPSRTSLGSLVRSGRLRPGTVIFGVHRNVRHMATVEADGRVRLDDDTYRLLDDAEATATGRKSCAGWKFWHVSVRGAAAVPLAVFRDDPNLTAT